MRKGVAQTRHEHSRNATDAVATVANHYILMSLAIRKNPRKAKAPRDELRIINEDRGKTNKLSPGFNKG